MLRALLVLLGIPAWDAAILLRHSRGILPVGWAAQQDDFSEYNEAISHEESIPSNLSAAVVSTPAANVQQLPMARQQRPRPDLSPVARSRREFDLLSEELSLLSEEQLKKFDKIQDGRISKDEVEIVLAHYDEDVRWVGAYYNLVTAYCKRAGTPALPGCIKLPNVGRESHTYLHHIVKNYDKLANWTVFSQAAPPTVGYPRFFHSNAGHMMPGVTFHDYVLGGSVFEQSDASGMRYVFNAGVRLEGRYFFHVLNAEYMARSKRPAGKNRAVSRLHNPCTLPSVPVSQRTVFVRFQKFLSKKCNMTFEDVPRVFLQYFDLLDLPRPPSNTFFFSQGARFAASRERIHQRPRKFYEGMLKMVTRESSPCQGFYNEWLWYYIVGKPLHAACR